MTKDKKIIRKHFRFTPQIAELLEDWAKKLNKTENELVATVLFAYLTDNRNFIAHEKASSAWIKEEVPVIEGITELISDNGTRIWWDADKDEIVKVKAAD